MEVVIEFKSSAIGPIPLDWEAKPIGNEIDLLTGFPFPSSNYSKYGIRLLRCSNVKRGVLDWTEEIVQYWPEITSNLKPYLLQEGDVVIAMDGSLVGRSFARLKLLDLPALLLQRVARIRSTKIYLGYIKEFVCSDYFTKYCDSVKTSSAIPHISPNDIRGFVIPVPPTIKEQITISNALSDMDALISQTEKLIEKKKAIKQGAMQQLLKPKEGWVTRCLGEVGEINGAGVDKKTVAGEIPVRLLNYMDVYKRDFIYSNELNHWVTAPNNKVINCSVKKGDIFFTPSSETRSDIGLSAIAMENIEHAVYSYHLMRFRINSDWDLKFKAYIFQTQNFQDQTEKMCEGGGKRYVLTMPKFRALTISFPENKFEQQEIAETLWNLDLELQMTQRKLTKLKQQKQGMMQNLLTGKIRLI